MPGKRRDVCSIGRLQLWRNLSLIIRWTSLDIVDMFFSLASCLSPSQRRCKARFTPHVRCVRRVSVQVQGIHYIDVQTILVASTLRLTFPGTWESKDSCMRSWRVGTDMSVWLLVMNNHE